MSEQAGVNHWEDCVFTWYFRKGTKASSILTQEKTSLAQFLIGRFRIKQRIDFFLVFKSGLCGLTQSISLICISILPGNINLLYLCWQLNKNKATFPKYFSLHLLVTVLSSSYYFSVSIYYPLSAHAIYCVTAIFTTF